MIEAHDAGVGLPHARQQPHERGLAGAARADDSKRFARGQVERYAGQDHPLAPRGAEHEAAGLQVATGRGQRHALGLGFGRVEQRAQAAERESAFGQHAPRSDDLFNR